MLKLSVLPLLLMAWSGLAAQDFSLPALEQEGWKVKDSKRILLKNAPPVTVHLLGADKADGDKHALSRVVAEEERKVVLDTFAWDEARLDQAVNLSFHDASLRLLEDGLRAPTLVIQGLVPRDGGKVFNHRLLVLSYDAQKGFDLVTEVVSQEPIKLTGTAISTRFK
jgi:hypothetical protein